jgi:gp16 family phage-associated protein
MTKKQLRTPEEVLEAFTRKGLSISGWAKSHGLPPSVVIGVLRGTRKSRIGQGHKAAVLLGLKEGEVADSSDPFAEDCAESDACAVRPRPHVS